MCKQIGLHILFGISFETEKNVGTLFLTVSKVASPVFELRNFLILYNLPNFLNEIEAHVISNASVNVFFISPNNECHTS